MIDRELYLPRSWTSDADRCAAAGVLTEVEWRRWTLLAHALLAVIAATERAERPPPRGLIPLACNEIRALFTKLITEPTRRPTNPLAWSHWRRHHQRHARASHYCRQQTQLR